MLLLELSLVAGLFISAQLKRTALFTPSPDAIHTCSIEAFDIASLPLRSHPVSHLLRDTLSTHTPDLDRAATWEQEQGVNAP